MYPNLSIKYNVQNILKWLHFYNNEASFPVNDTWSRIIHCSITFIIHYILLSNDYNNHLNQGYG